MGVRRPSEGTSSEKGSMLLKNSLPTLNSLDRSSTNAPFAGNSYTGYAYSARDNVGFDVSAGLREYLQHVNQVAAGLVYRLNVDPVEGI
jgi:hypothetical protein